MSTGVLTIDRKVTIANVAQIAYDRGQHFSTDNTQFRTIVQAGTHSYIHVNVSNNTYHKSDLSSVLDTATI